MKDKKHFKNLLLKIIIVLIIASLILVYILPVLSQ